MAISYERKKSRQNNLIFTIITIVLIIVVFLSTVAYFYISADDEAYEMLHIQTKQIKDDIILQMNSDRENLVTMANFASKLYSEGKDYSIILNSFEPIGLFSDIAILTPENNFYAKSGMLGPVDGFLFENEAKKGTYVSGRIEDPLKPGTEIVTSAVPIVVENNEIVSILYGVIRLETISNKYKNMAKELDAQLFVYNKETGNFIIDTVNKTPGKLSDFKGREYNDGYSYEKLITTEKGFSSFKSIFTGEDMYIHYSTIENFNWGIMLARYESQVFNETHEISKLLLFSFILMMSVVSLYLYFILKTERINTEAARQSSNIRKLLLEVNQQQINMLEALKQVQKFSHSRSAFFIDTYGEEKHYINPALKDHLLFDEDRKYFIGEIFRYVANLHNINRTTVEITKITADNQLLKTNSRLYEFFKKHNINDVSFAVITDKNNHVSILGVINQKKSYFTRILLADIAVCFSIAVYNKNHLNKTELAATTDSLTGVLNRMSYKKDILVFDEEKPENFCCIYIDVNELHIRNNRYGHAAGDEMLIYIANSLKEVFYDHYVYRMGGDEFLVFAKGASQEDIKNSINTFIDNLKTTDYSVAIGISYRTRNTNCEEMVREAEIRMYEAKAQYYQKKEVASVTQAKNDFVQTKTGIQEIDTMLSILNEHYNGIYRVSLNNNTAHRILMPAYLGYKEEENNFSLLLTRYIEEIVHPDYHRALASFLNYDALKKQLSEGTIPRTTYKKANGETVKLSVYNMETNGNTVDNTLWVFAKI